jgi:hypothetical protein
MDYDYSTFLKDEESLNQIVPWQSLCRNHSAGIGAILIDVLPHFVDYSHLAISSTVYRVLAAYITVPSAICSSLPILFCHGRSGTGKSQLGKLVAKLWNVRILSPADTFASIRNELETSKQGMVEIPREGSDLTDIKRVERHCFMVWDDIDPSILTVKPDIFRLLKVGCDRSTSIMSVSSTEAGKNLEFNCFAPKMFSSVSPLFNLKEFQELNRRMLIVPHKQTSFQSEHLEDYDLKELGKEIRKFWDYEAAKNLYLEKRKYRQRVKSSTRIPASSIFLLGDLIAAGVASGVWSSVDIAIKDMELFFQNQKEYAEKDVDAFQVLIEEYCREKEREGCTSVNNTLLTQKRDFWLKEGYLTERPARGELATIMRGLGYFLDKINWIKE